MTGSFSQGRRPLKFIVVQSARGNLRRSLTISTFKVGHRLKRQDSDRVYAVVRNQHQGFLFEMLIPGRFALLLDEFTKEYHLTTVLIPGQPRSKDLPATCPPVFTPLSERKW